MDYNIGDIIKIRKVKHHKHGLLTRDEVASTYTDCFEVIKTMERDNLVQVKFRGCVIWWFDTNEVYMASPIYIGGE